MDPCGLIQINELININIIISSYSNHISYRAKNCKVFRWGNITAVEWQILTWKTALLVFVGLGEKLWQCEHWSMLRHSLNCSREFQ